MATVDDAPALAELRWEFRLAEAGGQATYSHAEFVRVCTDYFSLAIQRGEWTCWVAEEDGHLVSSTCVYTIRKIPHPNNLTPTFAYVSNVYTCPEFRNRGVGSELMRHVIAWGKAQGFEDLTLWPSERSVPFYERAGFTPDSAVLTLRFESEPDA
jgi:GNAT superfamily N-acetyltransferase